MRHWVSAVLVANVMIAASSLSAHHSPSAIFDMKKRVPLKGAITKVDWVNPHIVLYMEVKDNSGKAEDWKIESNPPRWFNKLGLNRADFTATIGQPVTVEVMVAIDGSKYGYLQKIVLPNGNQISLEEGQKEERNP